MNKALAKISKGLVLSGSALLGSVLAHVGVQTVQTPTHAQHNIFSVAQADYLDYGYDSSGCTSCCGGCCSGCGAAGDAGSGASGCDGSCTGEGCPGL